MNLGGPRASSRRATGFAMLAVVGVWLVALAIGWSEDSALGWVPAAPVGAGLVIAALLAADVMLPVPGTVLMAVSGAVLGPVAGTAVNAVGLLAGTEVGRMIGSRVRSTNANSDALPVSAHRVALTRGMPVVGEAVALAAGATGATRRSIIAPAALGSLGVGSIHAIGGSLVGDDGRFIILGAVVAGAASLLVFTRGWRSVRVSTAPEPA